MPDSADGRRAPPDWAAVRAAYLHGGESVAELCAAHAITTKMLYRRRAAEGWPPRSELRRRRAGPRPAGGVDRAALVRQLYLRFARQLAALDARLDGAAGDGAPADGERQARALATLARTLEKLIGIEDGLGRAGASGGDADTDMTADDIDRHRLALARRLERLARSAGAEPLPGQPDGA